MLSEAGYLLIGLGLGVTMVGSLWLVLTRKPLELRSMDQAEDFVNTLDDASFKRIRTACNLRTHRDDGQSAITRHRYF